MSEVIERELFGRMSGAGDDVEVFMMSKKVEQFLDKANYETL